MGGFSVWGKDGECLQCLNLPRREVFFDAIGGANQMRELDESVVWKCPDCIHGKVWASNWIRACKNALEWVRKQPEDWGSDQHPWEGGATTKQVAIWTLEHLIGALERESEIVTIRDEFAACVHTRCKEVQICAGDRIVKPYDVKMDPKKLGELVREEGVILVYDLT